MKCLKEYEIRFLTESWPTNGNGAFRRPLGAGEMQKSFTGRFTGLSQIIEFKRNASA